MSVLATVSAAALAGLLSWPHCAAMCGPLAVASCPRDQQPRRQGGRYLFGRLVGYSAMGALLGTVGFRWVAHSSLDSFQLIAIAALSTWCGYHAFKAVRRHFQRRPQSPAAVGAPPAGELLTLSPPARRDRPRPRWALLSAVLRLRPKGALAMGMLTAILPCGALVGAWLLAGATAHPVLGSLSMASFALASSPALAMAVLGNELFGKLAKRIPPLAGAAGWLLLGLLLVGRWWITSGSSGASCH